MKESRRHASIDSTLLLEDLSAEVAKAYFGQRAESYVFGSSNRKSFGDRIDDLCACLDEGGGFRKQEARPRMRAGGLDVVVWKDFTDRSPGKVIGLGQCKTGTSYRDRLSELHADAFWAKWTMDPPLALTPTRMYFVAVALARSSWRNEPAVLDTSTATGQPSAAHSSAKTICSEPACRRANTLASPADSDGPPARRRHVAHHQRAVLQVPPC